MVRVKVRVFTFPSDPRKQNSYVVGTIEFDGEVYAAATAYPDDVERSFARVTENSGYFPVLGSGVQAGPSEARANTTDPNAFGSPSAWGNPSTSPPAVAWSSGKGGKKKGAGKKGVSLFSTTQRRSYR
ncbi:hypothetical protein PR003_g28885 [Phytophthora rubi]|uniref:Uncharacterized protein n=1 Tax=Phytophthora rubi TaxID=129364 RepID=A0A6A4BM17_9STRA|nr:hypothetical protein PR003_g28885 [Phytophthora rubi]